MLKTATSMMRETAESTGGAVGRYTTSPFSAHPKTACITCTASSASVSGSCWAKILIGISKCSRQRFTIPPSTRWRSSSSGHATQSIAARLSFLRLLPRVLSSGGRPFHGSPRGSFKRRRNAHTAAYDLWVHPAGLGVAAGFWTTLVCHPASGWSRPLRTISRRMGVVAKTVLAAPPRERRNHPCPL